MPISHVHARVASLALVSPKTIHNWVLLDAIPIERQALIEIRTKGALKMDKIDG